MIEFEPYTLLTQIQAGKAPETCWVLRPQSQVRFVTIFYIVIGAAVIGVAGHQQISNNPFDIYTLHPFLALLPQLATVGLTLFLRNLLIHAQDSLLVFHPAGIIHYQRLSNERKRKITVIEYHKTEKIVLQLSGNAAFDIAADDIMSHGNIVFEIHDKNGKKKSWYPYGAFGHSHEIAQWVIRTYRAFKSQETQE